MSPFPSFTLQFDTIPLYTSGFLVLWGLSYHLLDTRVFILIIQRSAPLLLSSKAQYQNFNIGAWSSPDLKTLNFSSWSLASTALNIVQALDFSHFPRNRSEITKFAQQGIIAQLLPLKNIKNNQENRL